MDQEVMEILSVIQGIIILVALFVFFFMAENIADIKKVVKKERLTDDQLKESARIAAFQGKKGKAVDLMHERAFYLTQPPEYEPKTKRKQRMKTLVLIASKITDLGGTVSKPFADYLAENPVEK